MPYAVITIDNIDKHEPQYMHFKDKSQKAWNCTKPELIANFTEGERYFIDYNETQPKPGQKYGSKYINRARFWKPDDGENSWPDKEPYTGGGGNSNFNRGGGNVSTKKSDYDPEVGKRQTAANVAGNIIANARQGGGFTTEDLEEFAIIFPTMADLVLKWVNEKPKSTDVSGSSAASDDGFGSDLGTPDDDIKF